MLKQIHPRAASPTASASGPLSEPAPLSFQQEWLWNLLQEKKNWNFLTAFAWRICGPIEIDVLRRSLSSLVERHESLRTRIVVIGEVPKQRIDEGCECWLELVDFGEVDKSEAEHRATRLIAKFFSQRFDLAAGPIFEVKLVRLAEREHVLALAVHHIVSDAVSVSIMFRELWVFYRDHLEVGPFSLPVVATQYAAYAIWQRNTHQDWLEKHDQYWKMRLVGAKGVELPVDNTSASEHDRNSVEAVSIAFDETLTSNLKKLARCEHTTPAMVVLALYVVLLSRWCNQRDFVVPFNVSGRHSPEHLNMTGYFPHVLFLRIELSGNESFLDLLKLTAREFVTAYEHLDFGRIVSRAPHLLTGTFFQWLSVHPGELDCVVTLPGDARLSITPFPVKRDLPPVNVLGSAAVIGFWSTSKGIRGQMACRKALFTGNRVERFCADLQLLAEQVAHSPQAQVASFQPSST